MAERIPFRLYVAIFMTASNIATIYPIHYLSRMRIGRLLLSLLLTVGAALTAIAQSDAPNILFIVIDDLNDYMPPFDGHEQAVAPALMELAQ